MERSEINEEPALVGQIIAVGDGFVTWGDGWSIGVPPGVGKVGETIEMWGRGIGYQVRGMAINGVVVNYRTEAEMNEENARREAARESQERADFEAIGRTKLDADYAALPTSMQKRIDKFRANNPDFRWRYESYEMFCCMQAVAMATALRTDEALVAFAKKPWEEQKVLVPTLDDGHSGNTFGASVQLARLLVAERDSDIVRLHGALAPLVGSEEYGCVPKAK